MATTPTCPKCRTVLPAPGARCPQCGNGKPGAGEPGLGPPLLAKLEAAQGKPLALKEPAPAAAARKGKSKPIQTAVALIAAGLGLAGAVVTLLYLLNRDKQFTTTVPDANLTKVSDLFEVRLKPWPDLGKEVTRKQRNSQERRNRLVDAQGKVVREQLLLQEYEGEFTESVLEVGDSRPRRLRRTYSKAVEKVNGKPRVYGYEGRTVVFEWVGNEYVAEALGTPSLEEAELKELAGRVATQERIAAFLPKGLVRMGEPWPIDLPAFARILQRGADVDLKKSKGSARLIEAQERDTKQRRGLIRMDIELSIRSALGQRYDPPAPAVFKMNCKWETFLDASSTEGTLSTEGGQNWTGEYTEGGQKLKHEIVIKLKGEDQRSAER